MKYHFLLDNNIYRPLMNSKNGEFLLNFEKSIQKHNIFKNIPIHDIAYSITPFSIMEALGITIPFPQNLITNEELTIKNYKKGFKNLKEKAEEYFLNLEILKNDSLIDIAKKQSLYTSLNSKELEKTLITNPLKNSEFNNYFLKGLVFDFLCKYEFPQEIQKHIFSEFLIPTFFLNDREISRFSKFRIIKRLWDNSFYRLENSKNLDSQLMIRLNNSMKLKRNRDFLDCEIIHFSTIGDLVNENHNPVFSFTMDKKETVINRVIVYKSMINLFINKVLTTNQYDIHENIIHNWKQGMIVFCDNRGNFTDSIDISNIKAIND
ncbi:hypothetical protein [Algibacter sp. L3A6]|uniref:hypothetical protein n=1 Tax=Algibacter sp. L3A6 TaxID=2686366 RepID=UPI00131B918C|nr:hypothetical protein [Algibacter sp. L3A6]